MQPLRRVALRGHKASVFTQTVVTKEEDWTARARASATRPSPRARASTTGLQRKTAHPAQTKRRPGLQHAPPLPRRPQVTTPMPLRNPRQTALAVLLAWAALACTGGALALPGSPPPATRPQSAANSGPDPLRRPTSWSEAWAALAPYQLSATTAAAPCGTGPTTAATCWVRGKIGRASCRERVFLTV